MTYLYVLSMPTNTKQQLCIKPTGFLVKIFSDLTWPHPSTHPPITNQPNYTPTHGWGSHHRFQIFKWNWNILISSSVIEVLMIPGVPWGGVGRWMGVGVGMGVWGCPMQNTCACMHIHACTHACTCMLNMINMDAYMLVAICNFYTCIHVCPCMCMHVHMCGDTLHAPRCLQTPHPPAPSPEPEGAQKHQNSISLECCVLWGAY